MKEEKGFVERRKHRRIKMRGDAFAFLRPPVNKIGQLIDISFSGLSFNYFSKQEASMEANGLDLLADGTICLEDIPYTIINDFITASQ